MLHAATVGPIYQQMQIFRIGDQLGAGRSFEGKVANFCHQASGRRFAMRAARALPGGDFGGVSQTKIALKLSPNKRFLRFELKVGDILRALWKSGPKLGILDRATMDH